MYIKILFQENIWIFIIYALETACKNFPTSKDRTFSYRVSDNCDTSTQYKNLAQPFKYYWKNIFWPCLWKEKCFKKFMLVCLWCSFGHKFCNSVFILLDIPSTIYSHIALSLRQGMDSTTGFPFLTLGKIPWWPFLLFDSVRL